MITGWTNEVLASGPGNLRLGKSIGYKGTRFWQGEGTPLFSRPHLFCEGEVTQYLAFKELVVDSQVFRGANPKYWLTAKSGGILFEMWPLEKGHTLTLHPCRV